MGNDKVGQGKQLHMYDFRGVSGDLSPDNPLYGLYRFKKGFNGEFTEFIGEFDMPLSPFFYYLWVNLIPVTANSGKI
jgi:peptidoglycan pentaglycine glycine transferase (the first glycine)